MTLQHEQPAESNASWLDRTLIILAIVLVLAIVAFAVYYYNDRYVRTHDTLIERQIQQLTEQVQANPTDPEARVAIAKWYLRNDMIDEAIEQAEQALRLSADHQDALILLGQAYLAKGDEEQAIAAFDRVVELTKGSEFAMIDRRMNTVYYRLGELHYGRGEYVQAIEALESALMVDRTDADALHLLGQCYQESGDHEKAIEQFNQALRFVPDFEEAYWGLQVSYEALGMEAQALYAKGMVAFTRKDYAQAAKQLEEAAQLAPDFEQVYLGLGLVYEQLGETDKAITSLHRFLKTNEDSVVGQQALGRLLAHTAQQGK